ncbi:hypothetical protein Ct9H90mP29_23390 [bacterium]|nr:MAG: hypothetical protein Ct9H90mP29_23390 [bacterium]
MGLNFGDVDNDGWLDFYVGTGYPSLMPLSPTYYLEMIEEKGFKRFPMRVLVIYKKDTVSALRI